MEENGFSVLGSHLLLNRSGLEREAILKEAILKQFCFKWCGRINTTMGWQKEDAFIQGCVSLVQCYQKQSVNAFSGDCWLQQGHNRSFKKLPFFPFFFFLSLQIPSSMATLGACSPVAPMKKMMRKQMQFMQLWIRGWMNAGKKGGRISYSTGRGVFWLMRMTGILHRLLGQWM